MLLPNNVVVTPVLATVPQVYVDDATRWVVEAFAEEVSADTVAKLNVAMRIKSPPQTVTFGDQTGDNKLGGSHRAGRQSLAVPRRNF